MPSKNSQMVAEHGIAPSYTKQGRSFHNWVIAGTGLVVHYTPRVTDDFGNSVRCSVKQILWGQRQSHD